METRPADTKRRYEYELGHTDRELRRLATQAALVDPFTRGYFQRAGLGRGMRALDVDSGGGDVAFLAAELVGPAGEVVGTDRSPTAVAAATARAKAQSLGNVLFVEGDPATLTFDRPFDAIVGRYVLMFSPDPGAMLRGIAKHLRPGGVMVFHEVDWIGRVRSHRRRHMTAAFDISWKLSSR
jgi:ubiquinone/menaquinone biosynthesis C-methylase UbiE